MAYSRLVARGLKVSDASASTNAIADAELFAEIGRHCRQRMIGVYLSGAFALLMLAGLSYSKRLAHGDGWSEADGRIVAIGKDPSNGEDTMTSEFADANGTLHRDTQDFGYHYASGDPQIGQSIEYLYKTSELTGDFVSVPRADWILKWMFGVPAAIFVPMTSLFVWIILRQRNFRRWLVRHGRREPGEQCAMAHRTVPFSNNVQMWRLDARYFEPTRFEFVDCHSDWQTPPEPAPLEANTVLPPILVDPARPARYWLPVGMLATPR